MIPFDIILGLKYLIDLIVGIWYNIRIPKHIFTSRCIYFENMKA